MELDGTETERKASREPDTTSERVRENTTTASKVSLLKPKPGPSPAG